MTPRIRGESDNGSLVVLPVDRHLQPIYDLLANGVNTQVILVKEDGKRFTYTLETP